MKRESAYKVNWLLLFILAVGTMLRFYHFSQIPFMYDEVSAWARTGYSSFHDLIQNGVKGDGHPAGIQVFLNYWRKIFGDSEMSFKFPFLIAGMVSIWLVFRIGNFWFNKTVGYLAAAFIASIQYTVMYSQIARPYISGLFFSLMMVWCWTNYLFNEKEKHKRLQLAGYILFSALCCYDHYFSLLFAFIVGVTGLFFLNKENRIPYVIAGAMIVILFIPHWPITFYQLGIGGVGGWLAKPTPQFFSDYLNYVFQFSIWVKAMVIALIILSFIYYNKEIRTKQKFRIIATVWFLTPLLIGYYYSVNRNAVLQYSVLIFSFPFLLLFLFSLFKELSAVHNFLLVAVVMIACSYSLIFERYHYDIFYHQPVEQLVKNSVQTTQLLNEKNCTVLMNEPRKYAGYYLKKYHSDLAMDYWAEKNFQNYIQFRNYLSALSSDYFIAGNIPSDYLLLVEEFYPFKIESEKGFTYNYYCFAKKKDDYSVIDDRVFKDSLNLIQPGKNWTQDEKLIAKDSLFNRFVYRIDSAHEYGPTFIAALQPITTNGYNVLNISMHVSNVKPGNKASLVISFDENHKIVFWQEKPFSYFLDSTEKNGLIFYSMSMRDVGFDISDKTLSVYTWNKNKDQFDIDDIKIDFESGNPWIYGLIEKVPARNSF